MVVHISWSGISAHGADASMISGSNCLPSGVSDGGWHAMIVEIFEKTAASSSSN